MSESIQETADRIVTFIEETYGDADVSPGSVINELVVKLAAAVQNEQYNTINTLSQGLAISQVLGSSIDTYSPIMDLVASNYNTERSQGKRSTGKLKIVVAGLNSYTLPQGITFIQPALGLKYTADATYRVSPNPDPALQELKLYNRGGEYYFILPVVAEEVGANYQVSSGTTFSLVAPFTINNFIRAEAYGNFTTGLPVDTDKKLIAKLKSNLGSRRLDSSAGIANRLRELYPTFQSLSACGANDAEMLRSKQNVFGISTFGKADIYVRTSVGSEIFTATVEGTKISSGVWEINLDSNFCPGFYRVISILPDVDNISLSGTLLVTQTTYGYELTPGRNNEFTQTIDARFSRYQKATIRFNYTENPLVSPGETGNFVVAVSYQPHIAEIQDLLISSDERLVTSDYLVKAALPCFVQLDIGLVRKSVNDTYDSLGLNNLKQDIFNYINTIPFGEDLYASKLVDICHNYDISRVDLPIQLTGNILCNDGTVLTISDSDYLAIPTNISKGISKKTTQYFIDYYRQVDGTTNVVDSIGLRLI